MVKLDALTLFRWSRRSTGTFQTMTSRSGSSKASGPRRVAFTRLKMVVLAPIPRARDIAATKVKPGFFISIRKPYRMSCHKNDMSVLRGDTIKYSKYGRRLRQVPLLGFLISFRGVAYYEVCVLEGGDELKSWGS